MAMTKGESLYTHVRYHGLSRDERLFSDLSDGEREAWERIAEQLWIEEMGAFHRAVRQAAEGP